MYGPKHPLLSVSNLHSRVLKSGMDTQVLSRMTFHPLWKLCVICETSLSAAGSSPPLGQQSLVNVSSWFYEKYHILFFLVNILYYGSMDQTHGLGYSRHTFYLQTTPPTFLLINLKPSPSKYCPLLHWVSFIYLPCRWQYIERCCRKMHPSMFILQLSKASIYYGHGI